MILRLICPSGHVLDVDAQLAGRRIRCGACGKIMVVPVPATRRAKPATSRLPLSAPREPLSQPPAKPVLRPQVAPRPTAGPPPALPPKLLREEAAAALSLPEPPKPETTGEIPVVPRRTVIFRLATWGRKLWPAAEGHLPANVAIPGIAERRMAVRLATVPAAAALLGLLPVIVQGHANLLRCRPGPWPPCRRPSCNWSMPPGWSTCPIGPRHGSRCSFAPPSQPSTACSMSLTMFTPSNRSLILGLGEVRRGAPAWCGLMLLVMGTATWLCGCVSGKWRSRSQEGQEH